MCYETDKINPCVVSSPVVNTSINEAPPKPNFKLTPWNSTCSACRRSQLQSPAPPSRVGKDSPSESQHSFCQPDSTELDGPVVFLCIRQLTSLVPDPIQQKTRGSLLARSQIASLFAQQKQRGLSISHQTANLLQYYLLMVAC